MSSDGGGAKLLCVGERFSARQVEALRAFKAAAPTAEIYVVSPGAVAFLAAQGISAGLQEPPAVSFIVDEIGSFFDCRIVCDEDYPRLPKEDRAPDWERPKYFGNRRKKR